MQMNTFLDAIKARRSHYQLDKNLPIDQSELKKLILEVTELVPDAFNMKSAKIVVLLGKQHTDFWQIVNQTFDNKIPTEKMQGFENAYGTILYFIDEKIVSSLQEKFPKYADNFPIWANHANAMLQFALWSAFAEKKIGANIQHYNPVIDQQIKEHFAIPKDYKLIAQMPFGGIQGKAKQKDKEDISNRVQFLE